MIRNFRQLQKLELVVAWPSSVYYTLFSSITSTELRKVVFVVWNPYGKRHFARELGGWGFIDREMCGLVDRLRATGYRHTLEAEIQVTMGGCYFGRKDFTKCLPKFREKGVTIITTGDLVLHSSRD